MITTRPAFIDSLQRELLRQPLPGEQAQLKMAHAIRRADVTPNPEEVKNAAVLITFFEKNPADWHIIFIRRTTRHEKDKHGGQIAFPGGKSEPGDRDLLFTALREAEEEISLDLTLIDALGSLTPLYIPVSKFLVHPFVAFAHSIPVLTRQQSEIEEILEFPLNMFYDPGSKAETRIRLGSGIVLNHVPTYALQGQVIWGATAMIMSELLEILDRVRG